MSEAATHRSQLLADRCFRALALAIAISVLVAIIETIALRAQGETWRQAASATAPSWMRGLLTTSDNDSWGPMLVAWSDSQEIPRRSIYRSFYENGVKFQYPPTSLFPFDLLPSSLTKDPDAKDEGSPLRSTLEWLSRVAFLGVIAFTASALYFVLRNEAGGAPDSYRTALLGAAVATLALIYYPLTRAYHLGQIQIFLDMLIAAALLLLVTGHNACAGICVALCCLVKPQFVLLLPWAALQRNWRFLGAAVATGASVLSLSLARYGLPDHWAYFDVLQRIARYGEAYWMNQSVNGLVHRLIGNGEATAFSSTQFAPYNPGVHTATIVSSLLIVAVALACARRRGALGSTIIGFGIVTIAATIASPIAWEHHYGVLFPVAIVSLPIIVSRRPLDRWSTTAWLVAVVAMGCILLRPDLIHQVWWGTVLGTHIFFGGLLLFVTLCLTNSKLPHAPSPSRVDSNPSLPLIDSRTSLGSNTVK